MHLSYSWETYAVFDIQRLTLAAAFEGREDLLRAALRLEGSDTWV